MKHQKSNNHAGGVPFTGPIRGLKKNYGADTGPIRGLKVLEESRVDEKRVDQPALSRRLPPRRGKARTTSTRTTVQSTRSTSPSWWCRGLLQDLIIYTMEVKGIQLPVHWARDIGIFAALGRQQYGPEQIEMYWQIYLDWAPVHDREWWEKTGYSVPNFRQKLSALASYHIERKRARSRVEEAEPFAPGFREPKLPGMDMPQIPDEWLRRRSRRDCLENDRKFCSWCRSRGCWKEEQEK